MGLNLYQVAVDSRDPAALAAFWTEALSWHVLVDEPDEVVIGADPDHYPGLVFVPVPEGKQIKNRLHLDLVPEGRSQQAEVERLLALGAVRRDVGQGASAGWVVLADPEGNEFCVLAPKHSLTG